MQPPPDNVVSLCEMIRHCALCPRRCGVDRTGEELGACGIGSEAVVYSAGPHFGEEPVLVGLGGSGTIFFSGCNLDCVFCQNAEISHDSTGRRSSPRQLAETMLQLGRSGCENINFVTPTHVAHAVTEAIWRAREGGLTVPIVYNCGGYESLETLRLLEGLVEIYMPDFKYAHPEAGRRFSGAEDYPTIAAAALAEMFRQVGPIRTDGRDVALRGVLVRHLVMPKDLARSRDVIDIVAETAPGCTINVMGQYRPCFRAKEFPELTACPSPKTIRDLQSYAVSLGLVPAR